MPKNEGQKGQFKANTGGIKTEPPANVTPTYSELDIDKKDAPRWQQMADYEKEIIGQQGFLFKGLVNNRN